MVDDEHARPTTSISTRAWTPTRAISRRLYYKSDGDQRTDEYDFVTYFEYPNDPRNSKWRFVIEGPEWRGRRVLHW